MNGFMQFFTEALNNPDMEVENEFDPAEIEIGLKEEQEHRDLYDIFKKCADDNKIEMPISEEDFFLTIVKAHLREDSKYYSKLVECMKKDINESIDDKLKWEKVKDGNFYEYILKTPSIDFRVNYSFVGNWKGYFGKHKEMGWRVHIIKNGESKPLPTSHQTLAQAKEAVKTYIERNT